MYYVVDQSNVIVGVDDGWDASATEHSKSADAPRADRIIGRPLDTFLAGDATKMFVRAALDAARLLGKTRRLPYRCDDLYHRRRFEMVISPLEDGHVKVEHVLIEALPRVPGAQRVRSTVNAGWRCSQCSLVRLVGSTEWLESNLEPSSPLAQDVCPTCAQRLFEIRPIAPLRPGD